MSEQNTEDDSGLEALPVHRNRWDQRELLKSIVERHFDIVEPLGGIWPSWMVDELDDVEPDESLNALNRHLERLDWMAKLKLDEPYRLRILPRPSGLFILENKQRLIFWMLALFSAWAMGIEWIRTLEGGDNWFDVGLLARAMALYAIPLMLGILIASRAQIIVAARHGMRVGGILPILFPIQLTLWPFGIASIPSHPRMDSMPWMDQRRMALICITAPLTMLGIGTLLYIAGIVLTPASMPGLNDVPIKLNPALLPEVLVGLLPDSLSSDLAGYWLHPLGLAGMALMTMAWLSLLPLPTLPGGRIMVALLGIEDASKTSTQVALMALLFGFGLIYGLLEGNVLWSLVVIGGLTLLFFYGSEQRLPLVLNEATAIEENTARNIAAVFAISLLLFLPAQSPFEQIDDWDAGLVLEWDELQYPYDDGVYRFSIDNPSLLARELSLTFWHSDQVEIEFSLDCTMDCNAMSIPPHSNVEVTLQFSGSQSHGQSVDGLLIAEFSGVAEHHRMILASDAAVHSIQPRWEWNGDMVNPELCTNITAVNSSFSISLASPWELTMPESGLLSEGAQKVCATGLAGALLSELEHVRNPLLVATSGNESISISQLQPRPLNSLLSPESGWNISAVNGSQIPIGTSPFTESAELQIALDDEDLCSESLSHPLYSDSEDLQWNATRYFARTILPSQINGSLSVELPTDGRLLACDRDSPLNTVPYGIVSGPAVLVDSRLDWAGVPLFSLANCVNCGAEGTAGTLEIPVSNLGSTTVEISVRNHGDLTPWSLNSSLELNADSNSQLVVEWSMDDSVDVMLLAWLDISAGEIELHLAAWSEVG